MDEVKFIKWPYFIFELLFTIQRTYITDFLRGTVHDLDNEV